MFTETQNDDAFQRQKLKLWSRVQNSWKCLAAQNFPLAKCVNHNILPRCVKARNRDISTTCFKVRMLLHFAKMRQSIPKATIHQNANKHVMILLKCVMTHVKQDSCTVVFSSWGLEHCILEPALLLSLSLQSWTILARHLSLI